LAGKCGVFKIRFLSFTGQIDGQEVTAQTVLPPRPAPRPPRRSPPPIRRGGPPGGRWRHSPPPRFRDRR